MFCKLSRLRNAGHGNICIFILYRVQRANELAPYFSWSSNHKKNWDTFSLSWKAYYSIKWMRKLLADYLYLLNKYDGDWIDRLALKCYMHIKPIMQSFRWISRFYYLYGQSFRDLENLLILNSGIIILLFGQSALQSCCKTKAYKPRLYLIIALLLLIIRLYSWCHLFHLSALWMNNLFGLFSVYY